ncbi:Rqc2 family fibronectin-binding protein [Qiania dongpingensis]|uniref:Rqc2 homolog RqcH n=1 Tax=Qiania dongpingensis TaxID=2763669 RepID=A0A7G9G515_9FIRM|nr:NFACT RNA binding domain-containing protein [Qiania dongpingensis]QNM05897.1 NFACT family protein [Qiania dongpingensis]
MALDGIVIACMAKEMKERITGGRITKIAQPEADALMLTIKNQKDTWKLFLSAGASLPLVYFTEQNKQSPMTAPNFCMLLRKHIGGGRILSVTQPGLERILELEIEHLDEMGDLCRKRLVAEFMGKHSNLIFCDSSDTIIDSIKHIPLSVSSVREVLPGRPYFIPDTMKKENPLSLSEESFFSGAAAKPMPISKALYTGYTGLSPVMAEEICYAASLDSSRPINTLSSLELTHLFGIFRAFMEDVKSGRFTPCIAYDGRLPVEFSALPLTHLAAYEQKTFDSISEVLESYYASRETVTRIRQKSVDLRRIVQTALERNRKKYDLQLRQLKDTEKRDKFRIYGELINTYGYELESGAKVLEALNYYSGETVKIPLDDTMTPQENAKRYFDRYGKLKRTFEALTELTKETKEEIDYLESVSSALDIARTEEDLTQIKEELRESGYIRKRGPKDKKAKITSIPLHYLSSDGYHIYVGKNNLQNEELTFHFASGSDWWFHAKGIPGSHVIVKAEGKAREELPDRLYEEAARLAAYYSKGRENDKVEIDYVEKKQVKKVSGAKPGFVIYHTNYSMIADPDISGLTEVK